MWTFTLIKSLTTLSRYLERILKLRRESKLESVPKKNLEKRSGRSNSSNLGKVSQLCVRILLKVKPFSWREMKTKCTDSIMNLPLIDALMA